METKTQSELEKLEKLKSQVEALDSAGLIELLYLSKTVSDFNPKMICILKTLLVRRLRQEGYL